MASAGGDDAPSLFLLPLPSLLCSLLTLCLCGSLVFWDLPLVPEKFRLRLRMRQLAHLARADMLTSVAGLLLGLLEVVLPLMAVAVGKHVCDFQRWALWPFFFWGLTASSLFEIHLALGILAGTFRHTSRLDLQIRRSLERSVPLVWILALALMPIDSWLAWDNSYDPDHQSCSWKSHVQDWDLPKQMSTPVVVFAGSLAVCINIIAYAGLIFDNSRISNDSLAHRAASQLAWYCFADIFTWIPYWVELLLGNDVAVALGTTPSRMLTASFVSLNGTFNYVSYRLHRRYLKKIWEEQHPDIYPFVASDQLGVSDESGHTADHPDSLAYLALMDPDLRTERPVLLATRLTSVTVGDAVSRSVTVEEPLPP